MFDNNFDIRRKLEHFECVMIHAKKAWTPLFDNKISIPQLGHNPVISLNFWLSNKNWK